MTDTQTASQGISVDINLLKEKYEEITSIDEKLDAASGNEAAGKRALANRLSEETKETWSSVVENMVNAFSSIEDVTVLIGATTGLTKMVKEKFGETTDKYLSEQVESNKKEAPQISAEEVETLIVERRTLTEQFRALRNMLDVFGVDSTTVPEPKKMTGSRGKRGPRVLKDYAFSIDGKELSAKQNTLSAIANNICKDLNWKVKDIREFLTSKDIDLENPPAKFEVELPNGKVLTAEQVEVDPDDVEDEPEDNEEE